MATDFDKTTGMPLELPQWGGEIFQFEDVNEALKKINDSAAYAVLYTLEPAGWTGTAAPFKYRVEDDRIKTRHDRVRVERAAETTDAMWAALRAAAPQGGEQGEGYSEMLAYGVKPTDPIIVAVIVWPVALAE